jgi:hypothetical protein
VWIDGSKVGLMPLAEFDPFRHRPGNVATSLPLSAKTSAIISRFTNSSSAITTFGIERPPPPEV